VSTARGSEPPRGPQTPGEPRSFERDAHDPALGHLISALTMAGHPHELAGRDTALAAFRAASAERRQPARGFTRRRAFRPFLMPARLAALVAAGATITAGLTAAAYAQALPAPVQEIAHTVLAPLGVPDSAPQPSPSPVRSGRASGAPGVSPSGNARNTAQPGSAAPGASSSATAAGYAVTLKITRALLPTGAFAEFTGRVTRHGQAAAGETVRLLERAQGASGWQLAATGTTGRLGRARFAVLPPTASELFLLEGPDGAVSAAVTVTVKPPLTFWLVAGKTTDRLAVLAPFSKLGTTVGLSERIGGTWTRVARMPLGTGHRAVFALPASTAEGHLFRVELPAYDLRSDSIWIPAHHTGAKVISTTPSPTPSSPPSPSPSPTASPVPSAAPSPPAESGSPTPSGSPDPSGSPTPSGSPDPTTSPSSSPSPDQVTLLGVVRWAACDAQCPRDDDEQKPGDPGGAARDDADPEPEDHEHGAYRRPGSPGRDAERYE
jgi:hypothetical protein